MANRDHEESMTEAEIIDATYWAGFWSRLEHWMFAGVVITLAVEFLALKFAEPHKEKLEHQRELKIAELTKEGADAKAKLAEAEGRVMKFRMDRGHFLARIACKNALKDKSTGRAEILWQKSVPDAEWLAAGIASCLAGDEPGRGWKIERVASVEELPKQARPTDVTVIGKKGGMFLFRRPSDALADVVGAALMEALDKYIIALNFGIDPSMPDDLVRVVVGAKP